MTILKWLPVAVAFIILTLFSFPAAGQGGNCNEADLDYLSENLDFVQSLVASCGSDCLQQPDSEACLQECLQSQTPLSVSCIECFNEQMSCAVQNCFFPCGFGSDKIVLPASKKIVSMPFLCVPELRTPTTMDLPILKIAMT